MRPIASVIIAIGVGALLFYGCKPSTPPDQPVIFEPPATTTGQPVVPGQAPAGSETVEQMVERWKELAKSASRENPHIDEAFQLATDIAIQDPHALLSLLDLVSDPQSSPYTKVLATLSLAPVVGPHLAPRLIEMSKSENEATTRACATNMLRLVQTEEVTAVLRNLKTDTEPRVRLHAQIGLATRDPQERREVYALYRQPDRSPEEKGTIIDALAASPDAADLPLMLEAAADASFSEGVRVLAIGAIGVIGGNDQVAALTAWAADPSEKISTAAKDSLEQIKSRTSGTAEVKIPMQ